jgi:hypothetical protein
LVVEITQPQTIFLPWLTAPTSPANPGHPPQFGRQSVVYLRASIALPPLFVFCRNTPKKQLILCLCERGTFLDHGAENWLRSIGKLLDAGCLRSTHLKGGSQVAPGSIHKKWQVSKNQSKVNESGAIGSLEEFSAQVRKFQVFWKE